MKRGLCVGLLSALGGWLYLSRGTAKKDGKGGHEASPTPVRDAGPAHMRDKPAKWDKVDEASDASFPASDPPSTY
ncbi:MAG: hypothetical protein KGJ57_03075 [Sphingomonadales bacterium]|nr:hypothetical protein [Sphingomonadales bacterium]MDE2168392.1 hypothetical protein [Sphingomonadales bacterium]